MSNRRRYGDDEKAAAVAYLYATGWKEDGSGRVGALADAERKTGIPRDNLVRWATGSWGAPPNRTFEEAREEMSERLWELAYRLLGGMTDEKIEKANLRDATISLAIALDKLALLNDVPTENTKATVKFERSGITTLREPSASGPVVGSEEGE